jgi:hypothetical protein
MSLETLDDIVEELADGLGIYGACPHGMQGALCTCRSCYTAALASRIREAVHLEDGLARPHAMERKK